MKTRYNLFTKFIYRIPTLPAGRQDTALTASPVFREALFLASRDLSDAISQEDGVFGTYPLKLQLSLLKYLGRMSSRCTPFGLFAGCGVGEVGEAGEITQILTRGNASLRSVTRLDMDLIAAICKAITDNRELRSRLRFYPNNTLYQTGEQYRYIDFKIVNRSRKYVISEIDRNLYLEMILLFAEKGVFAEDIVTELSAREEHTREEIAAFVDDLVDSQILISELYPNVTGTDPVTRLGGFLSRIREIPVAGNLCNFMEQVRTALQAIDSQGIGRDTKLYEDLEKRIRAAGINFNRNYLFQSDLFIKAEKAVIGDDVKNAVFSALEVLNRLTLSQVPATLKVFRDTFYKRYEEEEVPLIMVLDTEAGIGFGKLVPETTGQNILLEDTFLEGKGGTGELSVNIVEYMLLKKYHEFLKKGLAEIELKDEDLAGFTFNEDDLPATMATMVEIFHPEKEKDPLIHMGAAGGPSAANLLTRFADGNDDILALTKEIVAREEESLKDDQILAEIVHLPESRTGNILFRPVIRKYEIPYLALSGVGPEFSIPISDLMISIPSSGRIRLRSKRLKKEIIPRLSSAHNFTHNSLPVYHFLSMLQYDGIRTNLSFNWGMVLGGEPYLPRVRYRNIILSPATWIIDEAGIRQLAGGGDNGFTEKLNDFLREKGLPQKCYICYADNKLLIDFTDELSVRLFLTEVKKKKRVKVEEFLFSPQNMAVKDTAGNYYVNQAIFALYKGKNDHKKI